MRCTIINIADSYKHFQPAVDEYIKRTSAFLSIVSLAPSKKKDPRRVIDEETTLLQAKLAKINKKKNATIYLLDSQWMQYDSPAFSRLITKDAHAICIIWWAYGLDRDAWKNIPHTKLSLGKITLPHALAYTTLLEQIYRAYTIDIGKKYHY